MKTNMSSNTLLGNRLQSIIESIHSLNVKEGDLSNLILPLLPSVHLDKEYVLSSFRYGVENFGYEYIPYIHQNSAVKEWYPPEDLNYNGIRAFPKGISPRGLILRIINPIVEGGDYKDEYLIKGIWGYERIIDSIPPILPYFKLDFLENCILEAWVLHKLRDFLPKYWHTNYGAVSYIYGQETIDELFSDNYEGDLGFAYERNTVKDQVRSLDIEALVPQVKIDGDSATFTCAYWNHFRGLYITETKFKNEDGLVYVASENKRCLVIHHSNILF